MRMSFYKYIGRPATYKTPIYRAMSEEEIRNELSNQKKWIEHVFNGEPYCKKASFAGVELSGRSFYGMDLRGAEFEGANLTNCDFSNANLASANLTRCVLTGAKFNTYTVTTDASFFGAIDVPYIPMQCPEEGPFIGYKKVRAEIGDIPYAIAVLGIPEDALRSSATTTKCRCSKAKVLRFEALDGSPMKMAHAYSSYDPRFVYRIGQMVIPDDFDKDRFAECSNGIHFFMHKKDAIDYGI